MVTIFGWMGRPDGAGTDDGATAQMAVRLAREGFKCESNTSSAVCARRGETAFDPQAGIFTTICGRIRWQDAAFAQRARDQGNARALLAAYREHDTACLDLVGGEYALAIVDANQRSVLLAIDRMGIHPLCYTATAKGALIFGSSAELLRYHVDVGKHVEPQALFDYVYFHMVPSPGTIYRDIYKLEPAQYALYRDGKVRRGRYWHPRFCDVKHDADIDGLQNELHNALRTSVRRCEPDDQTGSFLSGGLDSSTVCGVLAEARKQQTDVYTIGFEATGYDEMEYARTAARHFNLALHEYYVTPADIVEAIPRVARAYDEPFGNSSAIPSLFCAQFARDHGSRVLLAGDGGDELFAGNTRYAKQQVFEMYSLIPGWVRDKLLEPLLMGSELTRRLPLVSKARSYIEQARIPMPQRTESYNYLQRTALDIIFEPEFLRGIDTGHPLALLRRVYGEAPAQSVLDRMLYLDWKFTLADNDLRKVMCMCATAGVEVRFPMLDEALVDLSLRVPPGAKIKRLELRHFYKQAMNGFLPAEIIGKSKHGFGLPFGEWLKTSTPLQELIYSSLRALKARGIIRATFIDELIETHRRDHAGYYGTMIWILALLEQWFQEHGVRT